MGIRINTNVSSINTRRHLQNSTNSFGKSMEKLSSGLRINRAGDDAAGLAISEGLKADIRALDQAGRNGADGISCWDLNQNGIGDLPDEDLNGDGTVDALDCNALASGAYEPAQLHKGYFTENAYEGTKSCMNCHGDIGDDESSWMETIVNGADTLTFFWKVSSEEGYDFLNLLID